MSNFLQLQKPTFVKAYYSGAPRSKKLISIAGGSHSETLRLVISTRLKCLPRMHDCVSHTTYKIATRSHESTPFLNCRHAIGPYRSMRAAQAPRLSGLCSILALFCC